MRYCLQLQMQDPTTGYGFLNSCVTAETSTWVRELRRNDVYRFRLIASNDDGDSKPSDPVDLATTAALPLPPSKPKIKVCECLWVYNNVKRL
jgi:hypothetical protein